MKNLLPFGGKACLFEGFLSKKESNYLFDELLKEAAWKEIPITLFGKTHTQPRLIDFVGDRGQKYTYSKTTLSARPWPEKLLEIKTKVALEFSTSFNAALLNLYRNGEDHMGFHSDDEKEIDPNSLIISLSLGAHRDFVFKPREKSENGIRISCCLSSGSLLSMDHKCQINWEHALPKRKKIKEPRINITFRKLHTVLEKG